MFRLQTLLFAAMLMTSATAFAADTPDPNSTGGAALPSGSNANAPSKPAASDSTNTTEGKSGSAATGTSPGEENKGKPPTKTE
jgi:hypothetical protein